MSTPLVILVGGFLGAGKTTLLAEAAGRLKARGHRVGLVTNDQAANLVDTASLEVVSPVEEVSGGCFCCRFDDLIDALDRIVAGDHDVLIGEPVGSCTDLSATVLRPLEALHRHRYRLAPLSVLVDPERVRALDGFPSAVRSDSPGLPDAVMYIYRKQLEEADVIVLNKIDLLTDADRAEVEASLRRAFPQATVMAVSAAEGTGVEAWLDHVIGGREAGRTVAEVDYDEYAEGEAALGWLNASLRLHAPEGADWRRFCLDLMTALRQGLRGLGAEVAHLKLHLGADSGSLVANLTGGGGEPSIRGAIEGTVQEAALLLNVRAHIEPDGLRAIVEGCLGDMAGAGIRIEVEELRCFAPARPVPTHRFEDVR